MQTIETDIISRVRGKLEEAAASVYGAQVKRRNSEGASFVRDSRAESVILQDWRYAYLYARNFVRGRWPDFEDAIALASPSKDQSTIRCVYNYVKYVRGSRMQAAEKHIANDAQSAVDYAKDILGGPWKTTMDDGDRANDTIAAHPTAASAYRAGM